MNKIGIMGGTFNPIHNGHLMIAKNAREQYALDEVIFMPCGIPYMKRDQKVESGKVRAEMTALAIEGIPYFTLSVMELEQEGATYTYETMERLKRKHPESEFYFILGADSLFNLEKWVHPERIFACCRILAAVRGGKTSADMERKISQLKENYGAGISLIAMEPMELSASEIRGKVSRRESIEGDVPERVRDYIEENRLYL